MNAKPGIFRTFFPPGAITDPHGPIWNGFFGTGQPRMYGDSPSLGAALAWAIAAEAVRCASAIAAEHKAEPLAGTRC
jgi:hypothetical protein